MQPGDIPPTPQITNIVQMDGVKTIRIEWTPLDGYFINIWRNNQLLAGGQGGISSFDDVDVVIGTPYIYAVSAINGVDQVTEGARSLPFQIIPIGSGMPFATKEELAAYWRTLTTAEETRVDNLLKIVSDKLRMMALQNGIDLDARIAIPANAYYKTTLNWVVMESVKRALQTPTDQPLVESYQQTAGPYSENYKYANPTGDLWFRKSELAALGISGKQKLSSITLRTDRDIQNAEA